MFDIIQKCSGNSFYSFGFSTVLNILLPSSYFMQGTLLRIIFLFILVLINVFSLLIISTGLTEITFITQFFIVLFSLLLFSSGVYLLLKNSVKRRWFFLFFFLIYVIDVIYLSSKTDSMMFLSLLFFSSLLGMRQSFRIPSLPRRLSASGSREKLIEKELDDDWDEKPRIIFE